MTEKMIRDAYCHIRTIDQTISDDVLDFMKDAAIEKLNSFKEEIKPKEDKKVFVNIANDDLSTKPAIVGNNVLYAVINKSLPNKRCVLNNYIGTRLEARNIGSNYIQVKLKKYTDRFSVPIDCVSLL